MTQEKVSKALEFYKDKISDDDISTFENHLKESSDDCFDKLMTLETKSMTKSLLFAGFLGSAGVHRFFVNDIFFAVIRIILTVLTAATLIFDLFFVSLVFMLVVILNCVIHITDFFAMFGINKRINYYILSSYLNDHRVTEA